MIREMICKNPNSKFKGILADDVIMGQRSIDFVFKQHDEKCFWPVNSTLFELIQDGWEIL